MDTFAAFLRYLATTSVDTIDALVRAAPERAASVASAASAVGDATGAYLNTLSGTIGASWSTLADSLHQLSLNAASATAHVVALVSGATLMVSGAIGSVLPFSGGPSTQSASVAASFDTSVSAPTDPFAPQATTTTVSSASSDTGAAVVSSGVSTGQSGQVIHNYYPQTTETIIQTLPQNSYVTTSVLSSALNDLTASLEQRFGSYTGSANPTPSQQVAAGGNGGYSAGGAINQLANVTVSSPSISGGSISNASVSATDLSASTASTGSTTASSLLVTGATTLSGSLTGADATFSGTLSAGSLSVAGVSSAGAVAAPYFTATDTAATSTFQGLTSVFSNITSGIVSTLTSTLATITNLVATNATTTNATSTNLYASRAAFDAATTTNFAISSLANALLATDGSGTVVATTSPTAVSFTATGASATSTFAGGITGPNNFVVQQGSGNVGIGTTTPGSLLSVGNTNGINFSTATSSFSTTGGINLASGCFAIGGNCLSLSNGTIGGVLPIANGGTATSTQVTNGINYFDGTKITSGSSLTFNGTTLTAPVLSVAGSGSAASVSIIGNNSNTTGSYFNTTIGGSQTTANTGVYYGLYVNPVFTDSTPTDTLAYLQGILSQPRNTNAATVTNLIGFNGNPQNAGAGTSTSITGFLGSPQNSGAGTTNNIYALYASGGNTNASGLVSNYYGVYLATPSKTGTITNEYGLYQQDSAATNYFAGNVGIGATSPSAKLQIDDTSTSDTAGSAQKLLLSTNGVPLFGFRMSSGNTALVLDKNYSSSWAPALAINRQNGNVGIGTTTPNNKFDVNGYASIGPATNRFVIGQGMGIGESGFHTDYGQTVANTGIIQVESQGVAYRNMALNPSGGNVGIGNATPPAKLSVAGGMTAASGFGIVSGDVWTSIYNDSTTNGGIVQVTAGGSASAIGSTGYRLALNPNGGNVSVGTTSSAVPLSVSGVANYGIARFISSSANGEASIGLRSGDDSDAQSWVVGKNIGLTNDTFSIYRNGNFFNIDTNGNVGIGTTTPDSTLSVMTGNNATPGDGAISITTGGVGEFAFRMDGTSNLNIDKKYGGTWTSALTINRNNGYVGIGTTTPATKLQVNGDIAPSTTGASNLGSATYAFGCLYYTSGTLGTCASDARLKTNIQDLTFDNPLAQIAGLHVRSFAYKTAPDNTYHGLIAQEVQQIAPELVAEDASTTLLSVKYGDVQWLVVQAVQELIAKVNDLANTVAGFAQSFTTQVLTAVNGTFQKLTTNELCVGQTCVTPAQFQAMVAASNGASASQTAVTSTATSGPPVIAINGNNPAQVAVGAAYNDLGARITGPTEADTNLGLQYFVDGASVPSVQIDTATSSTHTIDYVATNASGTSTSTRTVIVGDATSTDATSTSATSTDSTSGNLGTGTASATPDVAATSTDATSISATSTDSTTSASDTETATSTATSTSQ